jgi:hypothetical protein
MMQVRRRTRFRLARVLCLVVVTCVGCGHPGPLARSGVGGHYWVCAGPSPGHWQRAREYVEILDPRHNHAVVGRTVTRHGRYALYVRPGRYRIAFSYRPFTANTSRLTLLAVTVKVHKTTLFNDAVSEQGVRPGCRSRPPGPLSSYPIGSYGPAPRRKH